MTAIPHPTLLQDHTFARGILTGSMPLDDTCHETIDAALRRNPTDGTVHAAALLLAYTAGQDLSFGRSHARGWAPGLAELIDCAQLEAAAWAAKALHATYPRMPYLEFMNLILSQLPPAPGGGRAQFVDDARSDLQIVERPGAETALIAFCGARHHLALSLNLMDRWLGQLDSHVIYLRDRQKVGYMAGVPALGRDTAETVGALTGIVRDLGARRTVTMGNSAGGSGALRYARALGAERVLALAPITGGAHFVRKLAPSQREDVTPWADLVPLYRDGAGARALLIYGADNEGDAQQCLRMAGLPNVTVEALPDWDSHHLVGGLLRTGRLQPVLDWLVAYSR